MFSNLFRKTTRAQKSSKARKRGMLSRYLSEPSLKPGKCRQISVEALEKRELMAAQILDQTLVITASPAGETAIVTYSTRSLGLRGMTREGLLVTENGTSTFFNYDGVFPKLNGIKFVGSNNNDIFSNKTSLNSIAYGNGGNDVLIGGSGVDQLFGGAGHDQLFGQDGNDYLYGESGDDLLNGGNGADFLSGGTENDHLGVYVTNTRYNLAGPAYQVNPTPNTNEFVDDAGADTMYGDDNDDWLGGGTGDDTLYGGDGRDELWGHWGDDKLDGQAGNDTLNGGTENDTLRGGAGNDRLNGDDGNDWLYGGDNDDRLFGNAGYDRLFGEAGSDWLEAGSASEFASGGSDFDRDYNAYRWANNGATLSDVDQEQSGTCIFLATLAGVARSGNYNLEGRIQYLGNYTYLVQLYPVPITVRFDGTLVTSGDKLLDPNPRDDFVGVNDFWTVLYQRAYLTLNGINPWDTAVVGAFEGESNGDRALNMLTGRTAKTESYFAGMQSAFSFFDVLLLSSSPNSVVTAGGTGHRYLVTDCFVQNGEQMVHLFNPWHRDAAHTIEGETTPAFSIIPDSDMTDGLITVKWSEFKKAFFSITHFA